VAHSSIFLNLFACTIHISNLLSSRDYAGMIFFLFNLLELKCFSFAVFRTAAVNSAAGSAYAEFGNTKVIVSV